MPLSTFIRPTNSRRDKRTIPLLVMICLVLCAGAKQSWAGSVDLGIGFHTMRVRPYNLHRLCQMQGPKENTSEMISADRLDFVLEAM